MNKWKEELDNQEVLEEDVVEQYQKPPMYNVILLNDDYTPMDFVEKLLQQVFYRSPAESSRITLTIHLGEKGIAGVYSKEIAETKSRQANEVAKAHGHPLLTEYEQAE